MHQTYMSCQSQLEQSTAQLLHQYFPTYHQTQSSTIAVDWGDDNRITIWNQMRKSFLARDYALNRSSTPDSTASHVFKRQFYSLLSISNLLLLEKPIRFVSSLLHFNVLHLLHPLSARHLSLAATARSSRLLFAI